jgi:RimJ/RimL family protein N-acetyltransferase
MTRHGDDIGPSGAFAFDTERLHIRPLTTSDEALYCSLYTDPETMRFIGPALSAERAARSFQTALRLIQSEPLKDVFLTLALKTTSQVFGICSLQGIDALQHRAQAGIIIASAGRSRGLATEGLSGLMTRAFELLPLDEIWVQIAPDHIIVERLVLSVGFQPRSGAGRPHVRPGQRVWSVLRDSWTTKPSNN